MTRPGPAGGAGGPARVRARGPEPTRDAAAHGPGPAARDGAPRAAPSPFPAERRPGPGPGRMTGCAELPAGAGLGVLARLLHDPASDRGFPDAPVPARLP
ncbi:hypothetical protein SCWH03_33200 [Streptomyces pacificus]|uniref:Uncharacterized protein n=1 Tax=Streptomyces pacificus TaxID=2705029 RepID=A0A6A0AW03_9ACTN|nr:hypothetical protein SCWH03_33200 [Streptomyces pacificus]